MTKMIIMSILIVLISWTTTTKAQVPPTSISCIQSLLPCQPYLNSTSPPPTCCDPLKKAVETELTCLCAAFKNPALASMFNVTQAMQLLVNCGIKNVSPSLCDQGPTSSPGASAPSKSTTPSPPTSTNSSTVPPPPGNGVGRSIALSGPICGLMLFVSGSMFY